MIISGKAPTQGRRFPIIAPRDTKGRPTDGCPTFVPWSFVERHEAQAWANHGQTLERLAERGGLAPCELHAVVHGRRWRSMPIGELVTWLAEAVGPAQDDGS